MINGYEVLEIKYPDFDQDSRTPNGIDLRLGTVYELKEDECLYGLMNDGKNVPSHQPKPIQQIGVHGGDIEGWVLLPNTPYILEVQNDIQISEDSMQTYYPRSTLLRSGCTLHTAVGDAGYHGKLAFLFINHSNTPFVLEKGVRFAQLVDHQLEGASILYDGDYQDNKHKEKK